MLLPLLFGAYGFLLSCFGIGVLYKPVQFLVLVVCLVAAYILGKLDK